MLSNRWAGKMLLALILVMMLSLVNILVLGYYTFFKDKDVNLFQLPEKIEVKPKKGKILPFRRP